MMETYDIYYDEEGDFLEISIGLPANEETTDEIEQGIFITREIETREIKTIGILDFKKRVGVLKKVLKKFKIKMPLSISMEDN